MEDKIDRFAEKYRLWLVIPTVISGFYAIKDFAVGLGLFLFFVFIWLFTYAIGKILKTVDVLLPKSLGSDQRKAIIEACVVTLFLGGLTAIGHVLGDVAPVSDWMAQTIPDGLTLGFVDMWFAIVVIICFWAHAAYRVFR